MSIDPNFVELTAVVLTIFFIEDADQRPVPGGQGCQVCHQLDTRYEKLLGGYGEGLAVTAVVNDCGRRNGAVTVAEAVTSSGNDYRQSQR